MVHTRTRLADARARGAKECRSRGSSSDTACAIYSKGPRLPRCELYSQTARSTNELVARRTESPPVWPR